MFALAAGLQAFDAFLLDLAHTLTSEVELHGNLVETQWMRQTDAEVHLNDFALVFRQRGEAAFNLLGDAFPFLSFQLSHSSHAHSSTTQFPHVSLLHIFTSLLQFLQSSAICIFPSPHVALHFHTSFSQFLQSSAASISPFQQYAVHFHTSCGQFLQFSHSSIFPFQQRSHSPASCGHVSQLSQSSNTQFPQQTHTSCGQF